MRAKLKFQQENFSVALKCQTSNGFELVPHFCCSLAVGLTLSFSSLPRHAFEKRNFHFHPVVRWKKEFLNAIINRSTLSRFCHSVRLRSKREELGNYVNVGNHIFYVRSKFHFPFRLVLYSYNNEKLERIPI